ncbi:MAG: substrate-binding domain-containing protein, partial [Flavobacteriaceae bacterium]
DRHYPDIKTNYVIVDNFGGTKDMTKHLLNNGRKKIGFISIKSQLDALLQRRLGYEMALSEGGLEVDQNIIKELHAFNYEVEMKNVIKEMVSGLQGVDAIVFTTHYLAASGLRELKLSNIVVPNEVAIISFDELGAFDLVEPPITASKQPVDDIGNIAVEILINDIEKKNIKMENERVLQTNLLIRKSCGV